jgi:hypothetical protein
MKRWKIMKAFLSSGIMRMVVRSRFSILVLLIGNTYEYGYAISRKLGEFETISNPYL